MTRDAWTPEDGATAGAVACVLLEGATSVPVIAWAPKELGLGVLALPFLTLLFSGPGAYGLGVPLAGLLRRKDRTSAILLGLAVGPAFGLVNRSVLLLGLCLLANVSFADLRSALFFALPGAMGGLGIGLGAALTVGRHAEDPPSSYS